MLQPGDIEELRDLEDALAPVDEEVAEIKAQMMATHGDCWDFRPAARAARRPLFDRLADLSQQFGRMRLRRAELRRLVKNAEKSRHD